MRKQQRLWMVMTLFLLAIGVSQLLSQELNTTFENDYYSFKYPAGWETNQGNSPDDVVYVRGHIAERNIVMIIEPPFSLDIAMPTLHQALDTWQPTPFDIEEVQAGEYFTLSYHITSPENGEFIALLLALETNRFVEILFAAQNASVSDMDEYHDFLLAVAASYQINPVNIDKITSLTTYLPHIDHDVTESVDVIQELTDRHYIPDEGHFILQDESSLTLQPGDIIPFETDDNDRNMVIGAVLTLEEGKGSCGFYSQLELDTDGVPILYLQIGIVDFFDPLNPSVEGKIAALKYKSPGNPLVVEGLTGVLSVESPYTMLAIFKENTLTLFINSMLVVDGTSTPDYAYEDGGAYGAGFEEDAFGVNRGTCTVSDLWLYALP